MFLSNEYQHEKRISKFLASVSVSPKYLEYDNFAVYAKVKHYLKTILVNEHDRKTFEKFCRHWIVTKGVCEIKWLTKVKGMLKYYKQKESNYHAKLRRATLRPNSIKQ
jgi:hypothetical protein